MDLLAHMSSNTGILNNCGVILALTYSDQESYFPINVDKDGRIGATSLVPCIRLVDRDIRQRQTQQQGRVLFVTLHRVRNQVILAYLHVPHR